MSQMKKECIYINMYICVFIYIYIYVYIKKCYINYI